MTRDVTHESQQQVPELIPGQFVIGRTPCSERAAGQAPNSSVFRGRQTRLGYELVAEQVSRNLERWRVDANRLSAPSSSSSSRSDHSENSEDLEDPNEFLHFALDDRSRSSSATVEEGLFGFVLVDPAPFRSEATRVAASLHKVNRVIASL
mmetsp:Transcript_175223/g.556548  ORF Transcript_175223/g.556548 Transcript_175223/m.556548 type:complete len:151 (+) Transcript_175223:60-512(+)